MTTTSTSGTKSLDRKQAAMAGGFIERLRSPYREGQGTTTRGLAFWLGLGFVVWGCLDLWTWLQGFEVLRRSISAALPRIPVVNVPLGWSLVVALLVLAGGWVWLTWYLKKPWLADLLIETEGEMKKVSWPALDEAWAATKVVTVTVLLFTATLMVFDQFIGVLMRLVFGFSI